MANELTGRERVPAYHYESPESAAILEITTAAALRAKAAVEDLEAQFFPDTATWGIALWEQKVGIRPPEGQSLEDRRAAVRRKLTASGNTTEKMVRELGESFTGCPARVIVRDDYSFVLELLGDKPGFAQMDLTAFYETIEEIKPAHLAFRVSPMTWGDLESMGLTWGQLEAYSYTWGQLEKLTPIKPGGGTT